MIGKVVLMANMEQVEQYNAIVAEYGIEEAFNLGKINEAVVPKYVTKDFIFRLDEVCCAYPITEPEACINIQMKNGDVYTLKNSVILWNKLKKHLEE